jgi:hypothetical protein
MSASPQRFNFLPQNTKPDAQPPFESQPRESELIAQIEGTVQVTKTWRLYTVLAILLTFATGILAGYFLYLLWEQVSLHEAQLGRQQASIQRLEANGAAVSNQVIRLRELDSSVGSLEARVELQSQKVAELERGQSVMHDQIIGMNARWQREVRELGKAKAPAAATIPPPPAPVATTMDKALPPASPPPPVTTPQQSAEKHNETFSPDLKPTPNSYAQMSPSGLVVWMTPRPGFSKPVPASVIGYVRGLGMLVHDWDDNNHYFITESGSWILDQR